MGLSRSVAPTTMAVKTADVKSHANIAISDDDSLLTSYIMAATELCEQHTHRALLPQTWLWALDLFPSASKRELVFPRPPLRSITSVMYVDSAGASQTWASTNYDIDTIAEPGRLVLDPAQPWPDTETGRANAVTLTFVAGYADTNQVPENLKQGIRMLVAHWYERREAVTEATIGVEVPWGVTNLWAPGWMPHMGMMVAR